MNTNEMLRRLMWDNYTINNVIAEHKTSFKDVLMDCQNKVDWEMEGFSDPGKQRDYSGKFYWGHNHDFGEFSLNGPMLERHIEILEEFIDRFGLPQNLHGKKILDIGVWTGGTSLLLAALGAEVFALEEVKKYSNMVNYLATAFGLSNISCRPLSVYDLDEQDTYDYIIYSGVIYHVTDPVLSLRILFNSLKDGGRIFVETHSCVIDPPMAIIQGPSQTQTGSKEDLNRTGWNYYIPSKKGLGIWMETVGFDEIDLGDVAANNRLKCAATRVKHKDMLRAGLSRPTIR